MKVTRLIVYETDDEARMTEQMGMSMPDGVKRFAGMKITVCTMGNRPMMEIINKFERFKYVGTTTGRLYSKVPNVSSIPKRGPNESDLAYGTRVHEAFEKMKKDESLQSKED